MSDEFPTIKVQCPMCGTLMDNSMRQCESCGEKLGAANAKHVDVRLTATTELFHAWAMTLAGTVTAAVVLVLFSGTTASVMLVSPLVILGLVFYLAGKLRAVLSPDATITWLAITSLCCDLAAVVLVVSMMVLQGQSTGYLLIELSLPAVIGAGFGLQARLLYRLASLTHGTSRRRTQRSAVVTLGLVVLAVAAFTAMILLRMDSAIWQQAFN